MNKKNQLKNKLYATIWEHFKNNRYRFIKNQKNGKIVKIVFG